jgi:hypothetical protein
MIAPEIRNTRNLKLEKLVIFTVMQMCIYAPRVIFEILMGDPYYNLPYGMQLFVFIFTRAGGFANALTFFFLRNRKKVPEPLKKARLQMIKLRESDLSFD